MSDARFAPRRRTIDLPGRGGAMAAWELGDPDRPIDMIFVHANGFNARTYLALLEPLAARFRILAPDLRGHGHSTLPAEPAGRRGWGDHRDDLIALLDRLDGPPVVLAGHSMGGTASLLAAAERPERVRGLVLLDPVIWTRPWVLAFQLPLLDRLPGRIPLVKAALARRARFDSRDQAFASYRGRGAFKGWPDRMLEDYLADGLAETGDGLALACAPAWEASNYAAQAHDPWRALGRFPGPVHILKAEKNSTCHVPAGRRGDRQVGTVAGATHFLPMTHMESVRDALTNAAAT